MPITKSAKKALRQSSRRRVRNLQKKRVYNDLIKEIKKSVNSGKKQAAVALLPKLYKALDKAVKTNVIKKNKAARLKSRLTKLAASK